MCMTMFIIYRKFRIVKNVRLSWGGLWVLIILLYSDVVHTSVSILHCPMLTGYDGKKSLVCSNFVDVISVSTGSLHASNGSFAESHKSTR